MKFQRLKEMKEMMQTPIRSSKQRKREELLEFQALQKQREKAQQLQSFDSSFSPPSFLTTNITY
jgi:hypothetical protein